MELSNSKLFRSKILFPDSYRGELLRVLFQTRVPFDKFKNKFYNKMTIDLIFFLSDFKNFNKIITVYRNKLK
ncbi:hypothetical protein LEP1GSC193_1928 [Leptospira alstonii serovar Pingchang str. 80-412]|uniref:Uncharacterized protein n=2 Tax=Leptospira alstonii TaxID=28452 RepID=M6D2Z1_9LEPT|nr:hypothetical protein LEP1GSC194_0900 [Leptospira alstonii serovar Sichuan str. 79601]EQA81475.1 hypothetical protein LEP1GSC193_1928 [Leptospira alstonii serovar Pingchang str. 80-412]